jgi:hypothetical protein
MTEYAASKAVPRRVQLDANAVLSEAWSLYKRLFTRSVLMGAIIFGAVEFVALFAAAGAHGASLGLATILLAVIGVALLQGGLVEIVSSLHTDGDADVSIAEALQRASGKVWKLIRVSGRVGVGVVLGMLLLFIPGLVLMTRWAVAVPAAMLEEGSPGDAMRRSRSIVDGNGWNIFKVLFACGLLTGLARFPFLFVGAKAGPFGSWVALTLSAALTAPYTAHALTVVYYTLLDPGRPVALGPAQRWESVWQAQAQDEVPPPGPEEPKVETLEEEYNRKFEERSKQWGG